ncbi:MAG: HDOD domain-containing protein [Nitrospiraceae bacterium]|nr:HDOD domain-containing protein [Nitrospiraceae bacterium]
MEQSGKNLKESVLNRIRQSNEFPVMSETVNVINSYDAQLDSSLSDFANLVLKDYALTTKILRLVNTVYFSQFGEVTTISRAIILLGFENIRNIAMTLMLFEHFNKSKSHDLLETIMQSFYSGLLAKKIASDMNIPDAEEAFISSLFHKFGRVMAAFYLPDKLVEIARMEDKWKSNEDVASVSVMGATFEDIGMTIAGEWNFPKQVIHNMRSMRGSEKGMMSDPLYGVTVLANEIARLVYMGRDEKEVGSRIAELSSRVKGGLTITQEKLKEYMAGSVRELADFMNSINMDSGRSIFVKRAAVWPAQETVAVTVNESDEHPAFASGAISTIDSMIIPEESETPENIFTKGIQDMNSAILSGFSLNDMFKILLETMYRGMQLSGHSRTLFFIKDANSSLMSIRYGFGGMVDEAREWFRIPVGSFDDIFNTAISKQTDFVIKDILAVDIKSMLPQWYMQHIDFPIFVIVLPIVVNKKPLGLFYLEGEKDSFSKLTASQLNYLKIMRDQAVLAIKQKHGL